MEQQKRSTSPTHPTAVRGSHPTQPPQETHFNTSHPPSNPLLSAPNTLPSQTGLAQGQQPLPNNPRLAPKQRRAITRPPDSWASSMPHARESQATTMGFYHPAPTGLGGPETESISAAPGLWGDSYTAMATAESSYWYEPTSATSNASSGTANHDMSADGNSDGMETLELDHHATGYHSQGAYTTSESGIFLGGMEWNSNAIAPGMNPEMQRRMAKQGYEPHSQPGGLVPADPNLFAEFTLSSNAPTASTPNYAGRGFGPHLDDRWQRRGSSAALSIGSDASRRGQPVKATRRTSVAQDLKSKREHSHKLHRATSSPQRGAKEGRTSDRTTHNDVERKYRMNLKDKIAELRAAIPALQTGSEGEGSDPGTGATGIPKVSKGTVLSKATEYIHELEEMNRNMATEHHHLVQRLHELESLLQENSSGRHRAQFPPTQGLGNFESGTFD